MIHVTYIEQKERTGAGLLRSWKLGLVPRSKTSRQFCTTETLTSLASTRMSLKTKSLASGSSQVTSATRSAIVLASVRRLRSHLAIDILAMAPATPASHHRDLADALSLAVVNSIFATSCALCAPINPLPYSGPHLARLHGDIPCEEVSGSSDADNLESTRIGRKREDDL